MRKLVRLAVAGYFATKAMTQFMYSAPKVGMPQINIAAVLGCPGNARRDPPKFSERWWTGLGIHYLLGVLIFPVTFAATVERAPGNPMVKSLMWALGLWAVGQGLFMPLAGRDSYFKRVPKAVFTYLAAHVVYGTVFGASNRG